MTGLQAASGVSSPSEDEELFLKLQQRWVRIKMSGRDSMLEHLQPVP